MKKLILTMLMLVLASSSFAFVGIGVHGGMDLFEIEKYENTFEIAPDFTYNIYREAIAQPYNFGGQVYLDLPVFPIGFEAGFDFAAQEYKWVADDHLTYGGTNPLFDDIDLNFPGYESQDGEYSENFIYVRMTADVTFKYYFLNLPPVVNIASFYIGGGAGMYFVTPLVSEELFTKELNDAIDFTAPPSDPQEMDLEELVLKNTSFGGHAVIGVKIKPPVIPISINIDYKHHFMPQNDYKDAGNVFGSIKASLSLYI